MLSFVTRGSREPIALTSELSAIRSVQNKQQEAHGPNITNLHSYTIAMVKSE